MDGWTVALIHKTIPRSVKNFHTLILTGDHRDSSADRQFKIYGYFRTFHAELMVVYYLCFFLCYSAFVAFHKIQVRRGKIQDQGCLNVLHEKDMNSNNDYDDD